MATVSFDEKVVVLDPEIAAKMIAELEDDSTPASTLQIDYDLFNKAKENAKQWALKYCPSNK